MKITTIFMLGSLVSASLSLFLTTVILGRSNIKMNAGIEGDACRLSIARHSMRMADEKLPGNDPEACDLLRRRSVPVPNTIALGCAITTKAALPPRRDGALRVALFRQACDMLPFFTTLLNSLCRTISPGYRYKIFAAYDCDDPYFSDPAILTTFQEYFREYAKRKCLKDHAVVQLEMVRCNYSGAPAWSQNDALMQAYRENFAYYFMLNDDSELSTAGWTEALVNGLANQNPPNFGLVGPRHIGDSNAILTHNFVHKTHIDLFSFFYPRVFKTWYADQWITRVYSPKFMRESAGAVVIHGTKTQTRYKHDFITEEKNLEYLRLYKDLLRKRLACLPRYSGVIPLV